MFGILVSIFENCMKLWSLLAPKSCIQLRGTCETHRETHILPHRSSKHSSDSTPYLLHFRHRADNLPTECPAMNSQKLIPLFALGCDGDICHINRCRTLANNTMTITITDYWTQIMVEKPLQYFSLGTPSPGVQNLPLVLLCYRKQRMISSNHLKKYCAYLCFS